MAALLLAPGCILVGQDYQEPQSAVPGQFSLPKDPALQSREVDIVNWWEVFNDPLLAKLIKMAHDGNLDLKSAMSRVDEARAQLGATRGGYFPQVSGQGSATSNRYSENDVSPSDGATFGRYSLEADASWEIDLWGRVRRSVEASTADYQASEEDRRDVMITLYGEVARTYLTIRTSQSQLLATRENIISQRKVLELTRSRFKYGLATDLDVAQAETVLASTLAELHPLRIQLTQAMNALAILLGRTPGSLDQMLAGPSPIPEPPSGVAVGVPADLLRRRPDIRRSERQLAAATARIGVAEGELYPKFSLSGSIGLASTATGDLFKSPSTFFTGGGVFSWRIFEGGRIRSEIAVAEAQAEQAKLAYELTVLSALGEVQDAMVSFSELTRQVSALEKTVDASRRTLRLSLKLYKEGLVNFQNVLDAQRSLFGYETQLAQAKGDLSSSLVQLYKALGGGWEPPQDQQAQAGS